MKILVNENSPTLKKFISYIANSPERRKVKKERKSKSKKQLGYFKDIKKESMSQLCCYASMMHEYNVLSARMNIKINFHEMINYLQSYNFKKKEKTELDIAVEWLLLIGWCDHHSLMFRWCNIEFLRLFDCIEPHRLHDEVISQYLKSWWL